MGILGLLICGSLVSIVLVILRRSRAKERFPPMPFAWPVIGHLHLFFSSLPHQALAAMSEKYGPIIGLWLGQQRVVVVSSPEFAKQVLLTHDKNFADRPPLEFVSILHYGSQNGIALTRYGPRWRRHRRICTLQLFTAKQLQELEYVRQQEMRALLLSIHDHSCGGIAAIDVGECMGHMNSRVLLRLVHSNPTIQVDHGNLHHLLKEVEQGSALTVGDFIPSLSCLDFFRKQRMRHLHARIDKVYTKMLMERKKSASFHDDLVHSLLSQEDPLSMVEIKSLISDIIGGGIHTTTLTLEWAMAELLRNPHCLHRLQREIDTELGDKIQVTDESLPKLGYLDCVVKEVLRLHPIVPLLVPHFSVEDCELQGYIIPAKPLVFVNAWAIGRDEQVWPNANKFMPERFEGSDLDPKGQYFELLPFGSGRRICPGLRLALLVVHITIANLVRCFDWEIPDGKLNTSINMDEKIGLTANKSTPTIAIAKPRVPLLNEYIYQHG